MGKKDDYKDDEEVFSQEEINRLVGEARTKARTGATTDLMKELGVESPEELKTILQERKDAADKEASELSKANKRADDNEAKAKTHEAKADELVLTGRVEKALIRAGLSVEAAERARKLIEVDSKATDDDLKTEVENLKKDMPGLFADGDGSNDDSNDDPNKGKNGDKKDPPAGNPGNKDRRSKERGGDPAAAAKELLYERHPKLRDKNKS